MIRDTDAAFFGFMTFLMGILLMSYLGKNLGRLTPKHFELATQACASNQGLALLYLDGDFTCKNGLEGTVDEKP